MRTLFVIDSLTPGGTETSTVALAAEITAQGHEAHIMLLRHEQDSLVERARRAGVSVVEIPPGRFWRQTQSVRRAVRRVKPDIVHTALFRADQVGRFASVGLGVPVVSSFVSTPYDDVRYSDPAIPTWKLRLVQFFDAVTARLLVHQFHAVSDGAAIENARALRLPLDRITVVHRGRRPESFARPTAGRIEALRSEFGADSESPIVLNVGRLDQLKCQLTLIEAIELLIADYPDVRLLIAGKTGSASEEIADHLEARPALATHVRLLGHRDDIGDLLHLADVLVVASSVEGTAGAAIEAMAAETPVVSTRVAGTVGVLEHERNALLVERSPDALAAGIRRILRDPAEARCLAAAGYADFQERFTLSGAAERLVDFYRAVAVRPPRARRARRR